MKNGNIGNHMNHIGGNPDGNTDVNPNGSQIFNICFENWLYESPKVLLQVLESMISKKPIEVNINKEIEGVQYTLKRLRSQEANLKNSRPSPLKEALHKLFTLKSMSAYNAEVAKTLNDIKN